MTKTTSSSQDALDARVSRFAALQRLPIQADMGIPQEALDVLFARELLPVIGPKEGDSPIASSAPIRGAGGMTMTIARCPPGQGPSLHLHKSTFETFTVLSGKFELIYGDRGQFKVLIEQFDTVSVPPLLMRAFRNVGEQDGLLQIVISGGSSLHDIDLVPDAERRLEALSPELLRRQKASGVTFNAGEPE